jgi:hypothetical protein
MAERAEPVQIQRWPGGWCLVGNGPSYLLFCPPNKEVIHLVGQEVLHLANTLPLHRALRRDLQRYGVIGEGGELDPLVLAFAQASALAIYDLGAPRGKAAAFRATQEIEGLIGSFRQPAVFEDRLRRLATLFRAAGTLGMYHTPPEAPGAPSVPSPCLTLFVPEASLSRGKGR